MLKASSAAGFQKSMTLDEARALINSQIERGLENIPAEIITYYGLEAEYPELIAKIDREAELQRA